MHSWTIERLTHQAPEAGTYRGGPHPECPFKCLIADLQSKTQASRTEKDPRQGSPLSAWMGRTMEKDWPKRSSDYKLPEAQEKTLSFWAFFSHSHIFIVVINLCLYIGLLQFCGVFFFFLSSFSLFLIFKNYYYFSTFIPLFPTLLFPFQLILNIYKSYLSTSI